MSPLSAFRVARPRYSFEERVAAIGAAYEQYVSRLRVLNRLCCSRDRETAQSYATELKQARFQVEEAYARWFMLARPDLTGAPDKDRART